MNEITHSETPTRAELALLIEQLRRNESTQSALLLSQQRMLRRSRWLLLAACGLALLAIVSVSVGQTAGEGMRPTGAATAAGDPARQREALLSQLPAEDLEKIQEFEEQVTWLSQYMRSMDRFDPAAAVALFLSRMTTSVSAVPEMHREMQVMNTHMSAMPAIVAEMHAINAKLSVMTAAMDSTLGRSGRMAPWMPFSP